MTRKDATSRKPASQKGSQPVRAAADDTPPEDPAVAAEEAAQQMSSAAAARAAAEMAAKASTDTGWDVTVDGMSATATNDGVGPVTVHCSTATEAVAKLVEILTDPDYQPISKTSVTATATAISDTGDAAGDAVEGHEVAA